jgi:hypothetical protein
VSRHLGRVPPSLLVPSGGRAAFGKADDQELGQGHSRGEGGACEIAPRPGVPAKSRRDPGSLRNRAVISWGGFRGVDFVGWLVGWLVKRFVGWLVRQGITQPGADPPRSRARGITGHGRIGRSADDGLIPRPNSLIRHARQVAPRPAMSCQLARQMWPEQRQLGRTKPVRCRVGLVPMGI